MAQKRFNRLQKSLVFIEIIKLLKDKYTYKELSEIFNEPIPALNRYVKGQVIPAPNKTKNLMEKINQIFNLKEELKKRFKLNNNTSPILSNSSLIKLIAFAVYRHFENLNIKKVLTAPVDGLPIAVAISSLFDAQITYPKSTRDQSIENYIEQTYQPDGSKFIKSLYLEKEIFKKNEKILIVDDTIKTGATINALIELAKKFKANIEGIFVIISQDGGVNKIKENNSLIYSMIEI